MPFYEVKVGAGEAKARCLKEGDIVKGKVGKLKAEFKLVDGNEAQITLGRLSGHLNKEKATMSFDAEGRFLKTRKTVVYLDNWDASDFDRLRAYADADHIAPGAILDIIRGLDRLGREQAGHEDASLIGMKRFLISVLSLGNTERYSKLD